MTGLLHKIEVHMNFVVIEDDIVNRPPYVSVGEWIELWKEIEKVNEDVLGGRFGWLE